MTRIPLELVSCSLALGLALACSEPSPGDPAEAKAKAAQPDEAPQAAVPEAATPDEIAVAEAAPEPPKPAAELELVPEPAVPLEPDTVPIAPIKLSAATVNWRPAATPSETLELVALHAGVLASGASGYYDISDDGQLVLRAEIEKRDEDLLGQWPKDVWYIEQRSRTIDDGRGDLEQRELRLMRLRNGKRWVPQYFQDEQRFDDEGQIIRKSVTGGMLAYDSADDEVWFRVADNGEDPDFGVHHGEQLVAFFETGARKFYTVTRSSAPVLAPEPASVADPAPADADPAAPDEPESPAVDPAATPEAEVEAPAQDAPTAPEQREPALFVQTHCDDEYCVADRARRLPLGDEWSFGQQIPRKRHHLSAVATVAGRAFLLHYEKKNWVLEESSGGSFERMWPTTDGGLWVLVSDALWHRDPAGGWRNIELPNNLSSLSVAITGDKNELWIAGMLDGKPVVFATQAKAQEPPPEIEPSTVESVGG